MHSYYIHRTWPSVAIHRNVPTWLTISVRFSLLVNLSIYSILHIYIVNILIKHSLGGDNRTVCSGERKGWAAACQELSAAGSSLSGRGDDQSDSSTHQQKRKELEVTGQQSCRHVREWRVLNNKLMLPLLSKPLPQQWQSYHETGHLPSLSRHAGESHQGCSVCLHGLQSLPVAEEKCKLITLIKPQQLDWHQTPLSCTLHCLRVSVAEACNQQ